LRIGVGLITLAHFWSYQQDLTRWFGPRGLLPPDVVDVLVQGEEEPQAYRASHVPFAKSEAELWIVHAIFLAAAAAWTVGLGTRAAGAVTLAGVLSYVHAAPMLAGTLEPALSLMLFYLCLGPAGGALSLDRRLGLPRWLSGSHEPSLAANIALRLLQVHLAALYAVAGLSKLHGDAWWDGQAIWVLLAQTHSRPVDLSFLRSTHAGRMLLDLWTHLVLYTQLAFAPLVFNRLTRPVVLACAALSWLSLIPVTGQLLLCLLMLAACAAYLPELVSQRLLPVAPAR
jgi:hypothetical protein